MRIRTILSMLTLVFGVPILAIAQTQVTALEYFINSDPGVGNGTGIPVTGSVVVVESITIDLSELEPGFHTLYMRARNADGVWGLPEAR